MNQTLKLKSGKYYIPVKLEYDDNSRVYFHFRFSRPLIDEIKTAFNGRKWHGFDDENPRKVWSAPLSHRNLFRLEFLKGKYGENPYSFFDADWEQARQDVLKYSKTRFPEDMQPYAHQVDMAAHGLTTKQFIWAAEMGTGKTLSAFIVMEMCGYDGDFWWIGPKSALRSTQVEVRKWGLKRYPKFLTYEAMRSTVREWGDAPAPRVVIFDESSRVKNPTAKRSVAARDLTHTMFDEYGKDCIVGLMSGSPAPRAPADWWHQCEIACPGFLREATPTNFKSRLGLFKEEDYGQGPFKSLVTWFDDESKCAECGLPIHDPIHESHGFKPSVNEVAKLKSRMQGLVQVKFKKECLDLPDKVYEVIQLEPTQEIRNAAQLIIASGESAANVLTRLRELSDGFQYDEQPMGRTTCPACNGTRKIAEFFDPKNPDDFVDVEAAERGVRYIYSDDVNPITGEYDVVGEEPLTYEKRYVDCFNCDEEGKVDRMERYALEIPCPKVDALLEQLDLHTEIGRLNVYAGFTGSIERIISVAQKAGWSTFRADGKVWELRTHEGQVNIAKPDEILEIYASGHEKWPRICFVGQPGAAGMGLTLTASPTTLFYSNDFNFESRIQAEDRGHRIGMDRERGGRIIDFVHLDTDQYVLNNLKSKRSLQQMSLSGLKEFLDARAVTEEK